MRAIIAAILILFVASAAAETPKLIGRVNDHAGVLTATERATLERKLEAIEQTEGRPQVAVLLPASMDGAGVERFANDTYRAWKLGQAGKDNGVLIVIAPKERKWRIEVGYGLEGVIPDGRAKLIIANDMDPHLKGGKTGFYAALDAAVTSVAAEIAKERPAPSTAAAESPSLWWLLIVIAGGVGFLVVVMVTSSKQRQREERERAERASAAAYRRPTFDRNTMAAAAAGAAIGGGVGASAGLAAAHMASRYRDPPKPKPKPRDKPRRSSSSDYGSSSSSSSWSSSSSSDSSSSSSSSFSGGGGDSGGGGASGGD